MSVNIHTNHELTSEVRQMLEQIGAAELASEYVDTLRLSRMLDDAGEVIAFREVNIVQRTVDLYITKRGTFGCR